MFQTLNDPILELAVIEAESFACDMVSSGRKEACIVPRWLSLLGISGTGKTLLAGEVYKWAKACQWINKINHRQGGLIDTVRKVFWPKLLTKLRNQEYWLLDELAECNFVFLDEIAVEHDPSGFAKDKLCELLSRRVRGWTVLTSNLTLGKLAELDARIPSRMIRDGSVAVEMQTQDYSLRPPAELSAWLHELKRKEGLV